MAWARVDDGFYDHPKVIGLDLAAVGLWTLCLTWCHHRRDLEVQGYIPPLLPSRLGGDDHLAARLVEAGLWHAPGHACEHLKCPPIKDGWLIHDYGDYVPAKLRADRSAAGKKGAEARWGKKPQEPIATSHDVAIEVDGKPIANDGSRARPRVGKVYNVGGTEDPETRYTAAQPAAVATGGGNGLTITQRSKKITDAYVAAEPMCKWPAVNGIVIKAIKAERWHDDEILAALLRLAAEKRTVTVDTLRVELDGLPPRLGRRQQETDALFDGAMERARLKERSDANGSGGALPAGQGMLPPAGHRPVHP